MGAVLKAEEWMGWDDLTDPDPDERRESEDEEDDDDELAVVVVKADNVAGNRFCVIHVRACDDMPMMRFSCTSA